MPEFPIQEIPKYRQSENSQAVFAGALNASTVPHSIAPDEVQATVNIDYTLEMGGAAVRRGSVLYATGGTATTTTSGTSTSTNTTLGVLPLAIVRNYGLSSGNWNDPAIPWYVAGDDGYWYTGSGTEIVGLSPIVYFGTGSTSESGGGVVPSLSPSWSQFQNYTYLANGTQAIRTDGTNTFNWIIPQADTPNLLGIYNPGTFGSNAYWNDPFVCYVGTLTASQGTVVALTTSTTFGTASGFAVAVTTALTTGTDTRIVLQGNTTVTNWEGPIVFITPPTGDGIGSSTSSGTSTITIGGWIDFHAAADGTSTTTATYTAGVYATDYSLFGVLNPANVSTVEVDLSVGDALFNNYWTYITSPSSVQSAGNNPLVQLLQSQAGANAGEYTIAANAISPKAQVAQRNSAVGNAPTAPIRSVSKLAAGVALQVVPAPYAIPRSSYQFSGILTNPDFTNIQAVRYTINFLTPNAVSISTGTGTATGTITSTAQGNLVAIGGVITYGGQAACLNDQLSGIAYYQTYARVENGYIVAEGAASAPSQSIKCQYGVAGIGIGSNTSAPAAGVTHRCIYRTGGLLQDAYRVGSLTYDGNASDYPMILFDYGNPDTSIVANPVMVRNLWGTWPSPSAGTGLSGVNAVSLPWESRVFIGVNNYLYWTYPGSPTSIQDNSQVAVSDIGDNIQAIIPGWNLLIVNQASVYELTGSVFEGPNQNWSLQKSMSRRGCAAPRTCINTPYGVLLFSFDGLSMYRQGYGIDTELDWVYAKIGDLWKGNKGNDPAAVKGRIPALNHAAIFNSCAAYRDETIYLSVPTGTNTLPDTTFVINLARQKVWMYQYPYYITASYYDRVDNRLMAGSWGSTGYSGVISLPVGTGGTGTPTVPVALKYIRTLDLSTLTIQPNVAPEVTMFAPGQGVEVQAVLRKTLAADLTLNFYLNNAVYPNVAFQITVPSSTPTGVAVVTPITGVVFNYLDTIQVDIIASDGSNNSDGIVTLTIVWEPTS